MAKPHRQSCAVAAFLNLFGDHWSLLIMREAMFGATRFSEFQRNTGAAKNLLAERLSTLVAEGFLDRVEIGQSGSRHAYHITERGRSLKPVLGAIIQWGNAHLYGPGQEPSLLVAADSGEPVTGLEPRTESGGAARWEALDIRPGPGASSATRARLAQVKRFS